MTTLTLPMLPGADVRAQPAPGPGRVAWLRRAAVALISAAFVLCAFLALDEGDHAPEIPAMLAVARADAANSEAPAALYYRVKEGDTLFSVAKRFWGDGNLWRHIEKANGLPAAHHLRIGEVLRLPLLDAAMRHADLDPLAKTLGAAVARESLLRRLWSVGCWVTPDGDRVRSFWVLTLLDGEQRPCFAVYESRDGNYHRLALHQGANPVDFFLYARSHNAADDQEASDRECWSALFGRTDGSRLHYLLIWRDQRVTFTATQEPAPIEDALAARAPR